MTHDSWHSPTSRPRVAMLTPLPPTRTGVAHYASLVMPALGQRVELRTFESSEGFRRDDFDEVIYQLGNNPHHEAMYAAAMRDPGVVVLHDLVLHHLIVEMTLARGDAEAYAAALEASHGAAGAAWARGRAAGLHDEMGNFLFPASVDLANRSKGVIVHNRYSCQRLQSFGVTTPIFVVPHPYVPEARSFDRAAIRAGAGIDEAAHVVGLFGFLTSAKRAHVVLEAFRRARIEEPHLVLLIVGEPAPNIDPSLLRGDGIVASGYVDDDALAGWYAAADRLVNLRYPTAGETSGTLIRAFDAGKPVAVSDFAQFAELPDEVAFKVPLGGDEIDRLTHFFLDDLADPAPAQRRWLEENARLDLTIDGYLRALEGEGAEPRSPRVSGTIPLFPRLELVSAAMGDGIEIAIRNAGSSTIPTRMYGEPEYRMIAKLLDGDRQVEDRWLSLPQDLRPGEVARLAFPRIGSSTSVRLYHALQDVPMLEPEPWAVWQAP